MPLEKSEPTVGELLGTLAANTASLVKQEVHLASTEMAQKTSRAAGGAGQMALGGAIVHAGVLLLAFGLLVAIGTMVPMWIAALVLGAVGTIAGAMILAKGRATLRNLDPVPRQALAALKTDVVWAKEQVR